MMLGPTAPFVCAGCGSADGCLRGCPDAAELARALMEIDVEIAAAHAMCATDGHIPVWSRCDHWSADVEYVCDRCGEHLDEPPSSESTGGVS